MYLRKEALDQLSLLEMRVARLRKEIEMGMPKVGLENEFRLIQDALTKLEAEMEIDTEGDN